MIRSFVPLLGLAIALCGFVSVAHADLCPTPMYYTANRCEVTGTIVDGQAEVAFPQINAPGQASSFELQLTATLSGSVTSTYTCAGDVPAEYCDFGPGSFRPVLSITPGSSISFTTQGPLTGGGPVYCSDYYPNPHTCTQVFPWTDNIEMADLTESYTDSQLAALFVGTGQLTFGITETVPPLKDPLDGFVAGPYGPVTLDQAPYSLTLLYLLQPAVVPEPSLFVATAALLGVILFLRRRPSSIWHGGER